MSARLRVLPKFLIAAMLKLPGFSQMATAVVSCTIALVGVFWDSKQAEVQWVLGALALMALLFSIMQQVESDKQAARTQRTLDNVIRAMTPPLRLGDDMAKKLISHASAKKLNNCTMDLRTLSEGFRIRIVFHDGATDRTRVRGLVVFDHDQVADWSLLDPNELNRALADWLFAPYLLPDLTKDWTKLGEFVREVTVALYPDIRRDEYISMYYDPRGYNLGVPIPISVWGDRPTASLPPLVDGTSVKDGMIVKTERSDGELVPLMVLGHQLLMSLGGLSRVKASEMLAEWLREAWGTPTIFREREPHFSPAKRTL